MTNRRVQKDVFGHPIYDRIEDELLDVLVGVGG